MSRISTSLLFRPGQGSGSGSLAPRTQMRGVILEPALGTVTSRLPSFPIIPDPRPLSGPVPQCCSGGHSRRPSLQPALQIVPITF